MFVTGIQLLGATNTFHKNLSVRLESAPWLNQHTLSNINEKNVLFTIFGASSLGLMNLYNAKCVMKSDTFKRFAHLNLSAVIRDDIVYNRKGTVTELGVKQGSVLIPLIKANKSKFKLPEEYVPRIHKNVVFYPTEVVEEAIVFLGNNIMCHINTLPLDNIEFQLVTANGSKFTDLSGTTAFGDTRSISSQGAVTAMIEVDFIFPISKKMPTAAAVYEDPGAKILANIHAKLQAPRDNNQPAK